MNILPKKRWHVRTRENIARVRKDEQEAQKEAEEKKQRVLKAEKEARTALLRQRASEKYGIPLQNLKTEEKEPSEHKETPREGHVNFFEELEEEKVITTKTNLETELEEKEKREKYEKQIGYLTYLGQDTVETTGNIPWYDKVPNRFLSSNDSQEEKNSKTKLLHDPLTVIRKFIPSEKKCAEKTPESSKVKSSPLEYHSIHKRKQKKKKHKKKAKKQRKRSSSCSSDNSTNSESDSEEESGGKLQNRKSLQELRVERLKREKEERERTEKLLARLQGRDVKEPKEEPKTPTVQQKYNSQFFPELAKQNFATSTYK